ncbi:hypothetical protein ABE073_05025 [Lederbergia citrisecunda]|uniref:hypothetical protein n=1 Tax=Lederbergia citrisecunda TaxID=2833583 RepID=UPI003D2C84F5
MHNYGWDVNNIISKGNEQYNFQVETFGLNLDNFLMENQNLSADAEKLADMVINFLQGLLQDEKADNSSAYQNGYDNGYREGHNESCDC